MFEIGELVSTLQGTCESDNVSIEIYAIDQYTLLLIFKKIISTAIVCWIVNTLFMEDTFLRC